MNPLRFSIAAAALALAAAVPSFAASSHAHAAADTHGHGAHAEGLAALTLDHGKRWPTDDALRKGMSAIRGDLAANHAAIAKRSLDATQGRALGQKLEAQVGYIVANCKLEPAADAQLHVVVAELVAAADKLQGKAPGTPAAGAAQAVKAVNAYARYFDHKGFKPL